MISLLSNQRKRTVNELICGKVWDNDLTSKDRILPESHVNEEDRMVTRHSSYLRYDFKTPKLAADLDDMQSEKDSETIQAATSPIAISLDLVTRDKIVSKLSACISFYGNFVIIPNLKDALPNIANVEKNVTLSYWHDVMAFIDSYDLPYTEERDKNLIDDLVGKITQFVKGEGISSHDWQKILCTLPDDISGKLDYRLEASVIKEVKHLAEHNQLPFGLSKPITQLLKSAEKHAGKYVRYT
jgi:hypothetical protein